MQSPVQYFRNVRAEAAKVSWPSRKETTQGTIAVLVMVVAASLFLFLADQVMSWGGSQNS